jgi:hypothetical protein
MAVAQAAHGPADKGRRMSSPAIRNRTRREDAGVTQTVLISAQLLALNAALDAAGAGKTGSLLSELARDLRRNESGRRGRARAAGKPG